MHCVPGVIDSVKNVLNEKYRKQKGCQHYFIPLLLLHYAKAKYFEETNSNEIPQRYQRFSLALSKTHNHTGLGLILFVMSNSEHLQLCIKFSLLLPQFVVQLLLDKCYGESNAAFYKCLEKQKQSL